RDACNDFEDPVEVVTLMEPVLLQLLRLVVAHLLDRAHERQPEPLSQTLGEVGNELRTLARGYAGYPGRWRLGAPALPNHLHDSVYELVPKAAGMLVVGHHASPAGVAPTRENPSGLGLQVFLEITGEAVRGKRTGGHLFLALQGHVGTFEILGCSH